MFGVKSKAHKEAEYQVQRLKSIMRQKANQIRNRVAKIDPNIPIDFPSERKHYVVSERNLSDLLFFAENLDHWGQE